MKPTYIVNRANWAGTTWRIYAASAGLERLFNNGKPSGFALQPTDDSAYTLKPVSPDGIPSSFELTTPLMPAGLVSTVNLQLKSTTQDRQLEQLTPFSPTALPDPTCSQVRQYWDVQELFFTEYPLMPKFHRLEGIAKFCGEEHFLDLFQFGNVLNTPDKSLLVMRFLTVGNDSNSDGWAVGHN